MSLRKNRRTETDTALARASSPQRRSHDAWRVRPCTLKLRLMNIDWSISAPERGQGVARSSLFCADRSLDQPIENVSRIAGATRAPVGDGQLPTGRQRAKDSIPCAFIT